MQPETKRLVEEVLKLPPEARAAVVGLLIDSLDEQVDDDALAQWEHEIARRLAEIDAGNVRLIPWSEARRTIAG